MGYIAPGTHTTHHPTHWRGKGRTLDVIKHVIEQDLAEMISNPRLLPAVEARLQYLKK
jgi:hypothetical protein